MKLYFIRHGETVANRERVYSGQSNVELTEQGVAQAKALRPLLGEISFDRVYTSDLSRAIHTQEMALPGVTGIKTELLREIDVGDVAGMSILEVNRLYPLQPGEKRDFSLFRGETFEDVCNRVRRFLDMVSATGCENVAAFAHNGVLSSALQVVLNAEIDRAAVYSQNCAVHVFEFDGKRWRLLAWNYMTKVE